MIAMLCSAMSFLLFHLLPRLWWMEIIFPPGSGFLLGHVPMGLSAGLLDMVIFMQGTRLMRCFAGASSEVGDLGV